MYRNLFQFNEQCLLAAYHKISIDEVNHEQEHGAGICGWIQAADELPRVWGYSKD